MADINKVTPEPTDSEAGDAENTPEENEETTEENEETTEEKSGKIEFPVAEAVYKDENGKIVTALNADGLLIAVPKPIRDAEGNVVYKGYNIRKHIPLKKSHFAGIVEYMLYQAFTARVRAAILVKGAEEKEKKAARIAKFGDDQTRKKVNKLAKMKEAIEKLQKQLEEDGIELDDI